MKKSLRMQFANKNAKSKVQGFIWAKHYVSNEKTLVVWGI